MIWEGYFTFSLSFWAFFKAFLEGGSGSPDPEGAGAAGAGSVMAGQI